MKSLLILAFSVFSLPAFADFGWQIFNVKEVGVAFSAPPGQKIELTVVGAILGPSNYHTDRVFTFDFADAPEYAPRVYDACYRMIVELYQTPAPNYKVTLHTLGDRSSMRVRGCSISPL